MKKAAILFTAGVLLLCLTACGNPRFESQEAMFAYLNGIWVAEDLHHDEYYFFHDGQVHRMSDWEFGHQIEDYLDDISENNDVKTLCQLDYQAMLHSLTPEDILGDPLHIAEADLKEGRIILSANKSSDSHIIVEEDSVVVQYVQEDDTIPLKKISDKTDLSGECFEAIFRETKKNYTISTAQFWMDPQEYGAMVKASYPEIDSWDIITQNETATVYRTNEWIPNMLGILSITDTIVTFRKTIYAMDSWTSQIDWEPTFMISYIPEKNSLTVIDLDNLSLDVSLLMYYATYAVRDFPGAFDNYMDLCDVLAAEEAKVDYSVMTLEKTINGLTYKIQRGTERDLDDYWAVVTVTADSSVSLGEIMEYTTLAETEKVCPQCGKTEPDAIFTEDWQPGDICFGCSYSDTHGGEAGKRYCSQCGADCTYRGLEEDGRCGDCYYSDNSFPDPSGDSGGSNAPDSGSENTQENTDVTVRTCSQCGKTEPDAYFISSWKPGDICFGCSYSDTHGGEAGKMYCSQCGADCTYRGLEEDGRCGDCYYGDSSFPDPSGDSGNNDSSTACSHSYAGATCTTPQTCTECGATTGSTAGHQWINMTQIVYHEEQGHYKEVQDAKKVQKYRCWLCGYSQPTYTTQDEYYAHFDSVHANDFNSSFFRERYEMVDTWVYETVTVWVVDKEAYSEIVVTGRTCETCGMTE